MRTCGHQIWPMRFGRFFGELSGSFLGLTRLTHSDGCLVDDLVFDVLQYIVPQQDVGATHLGRRDSPCVNEVKRCFGVDFEQIGSPE